MIGDMARRLSSPMVVGRDDELNRLRAVVARGSAGETEAVVVSGEAGVGKTRLVEELVLGAESSGMLVATGGCSALADAQLPYGPVVAVVDALVGEVDDSELERLLGDAGPDLARIDPALTDRLANAVPVPMPASMIAARVFSAVRTLIERRARDSGAPRRVRGSPLGRSGIARPDRLSDPQSRLAGRHRRHLSQRRAAPSTPARAVAGGDRARSVRGADRAPASRPERRRGPGRRDPGADADAALVDELVRRADGNAFFTEELLAAVQSDGTIPRATGVQQLLLARIAALPDAHGRRSRRCRFAGSPGDAALAPGLGIPERDVEEAMHAALDAQVLMRPTMAGPVFRHALMQEAVYDSLLPTERRRHHLGFARAEAAAEPGTGAARRGRPSLARRKRSQLAHSGRRSAPARPRPPRARSSTRHNTSNERCSCSTWCRMPEAVDGGRSGLLRLAAEATRYQEIPLERWGCGRRQSPPCHRSAAEERAKLLLGLAVDANETFANDLALDIDPGGERAARRRGALTAASPRVRRPRARPVDRQRNEASARTNRAAIEMASAVGDLRVEALARGRLELDRIHLGRADEALRQMEIALAIVRATRDRASSAPCT